MSSEPEDPIVEESNPALEEEGVKMENNVEIEKEETGDLLEENKTKEMEEEVEQVTMASRMVNIPMTVAPDNVEKQKKVDVIKQKEEEMIQKNVKVESEKVSLEVDSPADSNTVLKKEPENNFNLSVSKINVVQSDDIPETDRNDSPELDSEPLIPNPLNESLPLDDKNLDPVSPEVKTMDTNISENKFTTEDPGKKVDDIRNKYRAKLLKIFSFYCKLKTVVRKDDSFEDYQRQYEHMKLPEFLKFGKDFNILPALLTQLQMKAVFQKCNRAHDDSPLTEDFKLPEKTPEKDKTGNKLIPKPPAALNVVTSSPRAAVPMQVLTFDDFFRTLERISIICFDPKADFNEKNPHALIKLINHMSLPPKIAGLNSKMKGFGTAPMPVSFLDGGPTPRSKVHYPSKKSPNPLLLQNQLKREHDDKKVRIIVGTQAFDVNIELIYNYPTCKIAGLMTDGLGHTIYFDRDPACFEIVLLFLKNGYLSNDMVGNVKVETLYNDSVFYGLSNEMFGSDFKLSSSKLPDPPVHSFSIPETHLITPSSHWSVTVRNFENLTLDHCTGFGILLMNDYELVDADSQGISVLESKIISKAKVLFDSIKANQFPLNLVGNHVYEFTVQQPAYSDEVPSVIIHSRTLINISDSMKSELHTSVPILKPKKKDPAERLELALETNKEVTPNSYFHLSPRKNQNNTSKIISPDSRIKNNSKNSPQLFDSKPISDPSVAKISSPVQQARNSSAVSQESDINAPNTGNQFIPFQYHPTPFHPGFQNQTLPVSPFKYPPNSFGIPPNSMPMYPQPYPQPFTYPPPYPHPPYPRPYDPYGTPRMQQPMPQFRPQPHMGDKVPPGIPYQQYEIPKTYR